jgi:hypothetical protein
MTECLSRILAPFAAESFLRHYQARETFHVARSSPDYYADLLTIADIDAILQSRSLSAGILNVVKNGERWPVEQWSHFVRGARGIQHLAIREKLLELYADGCTLVVNQMEALVPALTASCRALTRELGFPTQMNVYITPRDSAGFSRHSDEHDVMILQVAGSKAWRVYSSDAAPVQIDLKSGDLLYIPRGMFHDGRSCGEDSIHITLGLNPPYAFQLIRDLADAAAKRRDFQQPAPPRFAGAEAMESFEADFLNGLRNLVSELGPGHVTGRRAEEQRSQEAEAWPGRFADLRIVSQMTLSTVVCRRADAPVDVKSEGRFVYVEFGDRRVTIPIFLRDQLPRILGDTSFAISELRGMMTDAGKVKLVTEFVRSGVLRIVTL